MKGLANRPMWWYLLVVIGFCLIFQSWDTIVGALSVVAASIVPLVLGLSISYVLMIPLGFFERHFFPNSTSKLVNAIRRPVCLAVTVIIVLVVLFLSVYTVIPAFTEVIEFIRDSAPVFLDGLIGLKLFTPIRDKLQELLASETVQSILRLDFVSLFQSGIITSPDDSMQLFSVVGTVMSVFFGIVNAFIILTDTSDAHHQFVRILGGYLGPERMEKFMMVMSVADAAFHNFFVRQSIEAFILSVVGGLVLTIGGFPYALGVAAFLFVAALIPVVGYPVGLFVGALMVVVVNWPLAIIYIVAVALAQMLEATFLLPHVGDPRTTLPPVWIAVAVTFGGGIAGFLGMLLAIPSASTIYQLIRIDLRTRGRDLYISEGEDERKQY